MSKRLKRRILELCGFTNLKREEKILKANEILRSPELKQSICNQILGSSFKDIERAMDSVLKERQLTESQQEMLELSQEVPEKFDLDFDFKLNNQVSDKKTETRYRTYTMEEINKLLAASYSKECTFEKPEPPPVSTEPYPTYLIELQQKLVAEHFQYKQEQREKNISKDEGDKWDILKMTESEQKTGSTMKRTNSTKASKG